jgi:hypothetical protein
MKNHQNQTSEAPKNRFPNLQKGLTKILSLGLLFYGFASVLVAEENPLALVPEWKSLSEKELRGKLKGYAFAKIRTTMLKKMEYKEEKDFFYSPCSESFPNLPGDFPCNFLQIEEDVPKPGAGSEYREGGVVTLAKSKIKTPLIGGDAYLLGSDTATQGKEISKEAIYLFYNPEKTISHYRIGNRAVVFRWKNESGKETLKSILVVDLDKDFWAKSGREIDFSR